MSLVGYDIDGVITAGVEPKMPCVVISGRTFAEYDETCKKAAQICPVYIRGSGKYGDRADAGHFKASMIGRLGVTEFHEDDDVQIYIIESQCPRCTVIKH